MSTIIHSHDEYLFERIRNSSGNLGYQYIDLDNFNKFAIILGNKNFVEDNKEDLSLHQSKSFNKIYIKDLNEFRIVTNNIEKLLIEHNKFIEQQELINDLDKTKLEEEKAKFKKVKEVVEKANLEFKQGHKEIKNSLQNEVKEFDKKIKVLEKEIKNFEKNKTKKSNYKEINLHSQNAIFRRQALIEDLKFDKEKLEKAYDINFIERNSNLLINYTKEINKSFKENLGFEPLAKNYHSKIDLLNKTIEIKDMKFVYDSFKKGLHSKSIEQMEKIANDHIKDPTTFAILKSKNVADLEKWRYDNPTARFIPNNVKEKIFAKTRQNYMDRDKLREESSKKIEEHKAKNNGSITSIQEDRIQLKIINKHLNKIDDKEVFKVLQKIEEESLKEFEAKDAIRQNEIKLQKLEKETNDKDNFTNAKDKFYKGFGEINTISEKRDYIANYKKEFKGLKNVRSDFKKEFYKELETLDTNLELEQEKILEKSKTLTKDFNEKLDKSKSNEELEAIYKEINSKFKELDKDDAFTLFNKYFEKQTSLKEEPKIELKVEEPKIEEPKLELKIEEPKIEEIKYSQIALDNEQLARKNFKIIVNNKKYDNELKVNKLSFHLGKIEKLREIARRENVLRMYKERIEALKVDIALEKGKQQEMKLDSKPKIEEQKVEPKVIEQKVEPKVEEQKVEPKVIEQKVEPKVEEPKVEDTNNVEDEDGFDDFGR